MKYLSIIVAVTIFLAPTFSQATEKSLGSFPLSLAALGAGAGAGSAAGTGQFSSDIAPTAFVYAQERYETQDSDNEQEPCLFEDSEIMSLFIEPRTEAKKSKSTSKKEKEEKPKKSKHSPSTLARKAELARQARQRKKTRIEGIKHQYADLEKLRKDIVALKKEATLLERNSTITALLKSILDYAPEVLTKATNAIKQL